MIRRVTKDEVEKDKRMTLLKILAFFILTCVFVYLLLAISGIIR